MSDDLCQILTAATQAPSGENSQPWRFVVSDNQIELFNLPKRDQSLYNWQQAGSYVAHGAALENIEIMASSLGYDTQIKLWPKPDQPDLVATIDLIKGQPQPNKLSRFISERVTNRRPYKKQPLPNEQLNSLSSILTPAELSEVKLTNEPIAIKKLAVAASINEAVMLSNKQLHNFFFNHVTWTKTEDEKKKVGFYIKTLELPPPAQLAFRLFKSWSFINFLNKFKIYKLVATQNAQTYGATGAMGIITRPASQPTDFIATGRLMQKIWLQATSQDLALQPLTGVLFFKRRLEAGDKANFSTEQVALIEQAYDMIKSAFGVESGFVTFMFRVGYSKIPTARSARFTAEESTTVN